MGGEQLGDPGCCGCLSHLRGSRRLILFIVAIAILLDNMLLTSVVPIIPSFLYHLRHQPMGTIATPTQDIPKKLFPLPDIPLNDENIPHFLPHLPISTKEPISKWDIPGFTLVPNEVFWKFTTESQAEVTSNIDTLNDLDPEIKRKRKRHEDLINENFEVGFLFASKPLVQALANPFIGPISNKVGYSVIMFLGFLILFTTSIGMGMLAEKYPDDAERGNAMAIALGGLALGVLIGPVFGGTLYEFVGKAAPFLILASLALVDGFLQLLVLQPKVKKQKQEDTPLFSLLKDPYIMVAAGAITFSNIGIAVLEPSLPLWMMDTMDATKWQQGAAFLPASISYLIGTNVFGPLGHKMGRWLAAMIGLLVIGVCLLCVPLAKSVEQLIPANAGIGFAIGMVDSSMMPMLGYLVDIRHTSVYGCVYAIADIAFCFGFIIGPVFSATIVQKLGFEGSVCAVALISFLYAPLMILLRKPPGKVQEKPMPLLSLSVGLLCSSLKMLGIRDLGSISCHWNAFPSSDSNYRYKTPFRMWSQSQRAQYYFVVRM
ncbi:synaptic vesicular amine transporter-like isoform X3 [Stegodyphus dumicola]|uniref:synaptic vesicular amine transporter-like isoform X3 n=1 Tax=Stegodyphus dumicola TaxID=202533 RepID=UPI0015B334A4|nr:synaptic vesicular amine transporter-like isoform X3 [Stegodyphus dumicola]